MVRRPLKLFFSYVEADEQYVNSLLTHLVQLQRSDLIQTWHKRRIRPGDDRAATVDVHLEAADIILVAVSADFLASDYSHDIELKRSLTRHADGSARVVPIIIRPVNLEDSPLGKLQPLPKDGKPVATWTSQDEAWLDVLRGIQHLVEDRQDPPHVAEQKPTPRAEPVRPKRGFEEDTIPDTSPKAAVNARLNYWRVVTAASITAAFFFGVGANAILCSPRPSSSVTVLQDAEILASPDSIRPDVEPISRPDVLNSALDSPDASPSCSPPADYYSLRAQVAELQARVSNLATDGSLTVTSVDVAAFFTNEEGEKMISLLQTRQSDDQFPVGKAEEVRFAAKVTNNSVDKRVLSGSLCVKYVDPNGHTVTESKGASASIGCTLETNLNSTSKQLSGAVQNMEVPKSDATFTWRGGLGRRSGTTFTVPGLWHIEFWFEGRKLKETGFTMVKGEGQLYRPDGWNPLKPFRKRAL